MGGTILVEATLNHPRGLSTFRAVFPWLTSKVLVVPYGDGRMGMSRTTRLIIRMSSGVERTKLAYVVGSSHCTRDVQYMCRNFSLAFYSI